MHELAVAQGIVETCSESAKGARVLRVTLEIGMLSCVMPEAVRFSYEVVAAGTPLEGSELVIIRVSAQSRCRDCGLDVRMEEILACCPCGSVNLEKPRGGDVLRVVSMEVEEHIAAAS